MSSTGGQKCSKQNVSVLRGISDDGSSGADVGRFVRCIADGIAYTIDFAHAEFRFLLVIEGES